MGFEPVLIIGAGVCGLAIAHGLQKYEIPFLIFEDEDELALPLQDCSIALHSSIPMLKCLLSKDLADRLDTDVAVDKGLDYSQPPNNTIGIFDGVSGDSLSEIKANGEYLRASKRNLRALCHEGINVRYRHTLTDIGWTDYGNVIAVFENGQRRVGSVLVGCDGSNSTVREKLFGSLKSRPNPADAFCLRVNICYRDATKATFIRSAHPVSSMTIHQDCMASISILDGSDHEQPESWQFEIVVGWRGNGNQLPSNQERHRQVKKRARALNEPFRSALLWIPDDVELRLDELFSWSPAPWHTHGGRVTLAGDAVHVMPECTGQSLNSALVDAYNFVNAVKSVFFGDYVRPEAIPAYSNEVAARGAIEVRSSTQVTNLMLDYEKFKASEFMNSTLPLGWTAVELLKTGVTPPSDAQKAKRRRKKNMSKIYSVGRWVSEKIDYIGRGAEQGPAQRGWVAFANREYARRYFPN